MTGKAHPHSEKSESSEAIIIGYAKKCKSFLRMVKN